MKQRLYILYALTMLVAYFGFNTDWAYTGGSVWWTHLTFHFAHGNIFHLAANMLVVFLLLFRRNDRWWLWPLCYLLATGCSFVVGTVKPTLGLSGILFAYYGVIFLKDGAQWKPLLQMLAFMAVSCLFASRMAVGLHFLCLFAGALIGGFMGVVSEIRKKVSLYD